MESDIEMSDFNITFECNICYDTLVKNRKNCIVCSMCKNFNMCIKCFLIYTDKNTDCPYCRVKNGFAYWDIIYKHKVFIFVILNTSTLALDI